MMYHYHKAVQQYRENLQQFNKDRLFSTRVGTFIHYCRYADDFVIGVLGTHKTALEIKFSTKGFYLK